MKYLIIVALLFQVNNTYAQMVGDTRSTILGLESRAPCETRSNVLLYCLQGNDMIVYTFNSNNYCGSIMKINFVSRGKAEDILANKLSSHNTEPYVSGNKYTFFLGDSRTIVYCIDSDRQYGVFFYELEANVDLLGE
jgi:hypothetical protein